MLTYAMGVVIFVGGLLSFVSRWKHLLTVLLSLEMMMLSSFLMVIILSGIIMGEGWMSLIFLGFVVCEGGFGLGLVVSLVRSHGGDCLMGFVGDVGNIV